MKAFMGIEAVDDWIALCIDQIRVAEAGAIQIRGSIFGAGVADVVVCGERAAVRGLKDAR